MLNAGRPRKLVTTSTAILLASASNAAMAETDAPGESSPAQKGAPAQPSDQPSAATGAPHEQDIIVTAQRRSERLQKVPIYITAFTEKELAAKRILTTRDLQYSVPSLIYGTQSGFAKPFLRGIGSDISQINSDPSVATYVDSVYLANNVGTVVSALGVERIEVLAGPQGTLYGKNALGGAISVVTLSPSNRFEGQVRLTGGNYNRLEGTGHVSGPITDTFYVGVYALANRRDSYYTHLIPVDQRQFNGTPSYEWNWGLRLKAVYDSSPVRIVASVEQSRGATADGNVLQNIQPNATPVALGGQFTLKPFHDTLDGAAFGRSKSTLAILRADFDVNWANLVSISSYRRLRFFGASDFDGTTLPLVDLIQFPNSSKDYSQEFQLQSRAGSALTWMVGAYGFYENAGFLPTGAGSLGPTASLIKSQVKTASWAVFGQIKAPLTKELSVTLGARYSSDHKKLSSSTYRQAIIDRELSGPILNLVTYPNLEHRWGSFTPSVTIDYDRGDILVYAKYSKGYRPGAFNATAPTAPGPVDPETLQSYEVGSHTRFLNGDLRLDFAAYYYDFKKIQVQVNNQTSGLSTLQNGAAAKAYGLEGKLEASVTRVLGLSASFALEHSKYKNFRDFAGFVPCVPASPGGVCFGNRAQPIDVSGNPLVRTPKFVLNVGSHYDLILGANTSIRFSADLYHNSGFNFDAAGSVRQKAYNIVNASATYTDEALNLSISAWGSNLNNEYYYNAGFFSAFGTVINAGDPRTFGVTVTKKF